MGEFLSTPIKDKVSEDNENSTVQTLFFIFSRSDMELAVCKDGEKEWKIHTFPTLT